MATEDKSPAERPGVGRPDADPQAAPASRLEALERRLDTAFRQIEGRGDEAAVDEGRSLRTRRARLHQQVLSGGADPGVLHEVESLTDAIDQWVARIDQSQAHGTRRTIR